MMDSPFEGERKVAKRMLGQFLKKYDISEEAIAEEQFYTFSYFHRWEKPLFVQIYCHVMDTNDMTYWRGKSTKQIKIKATPEQAARIKELYKHYKKERAKDMKRLIDNAFGIFVSKNKLFSSGPSSSKKELSPEDLEMIRRMWNDLRDVRLTNHLRIENNG